jgi:purine-binding chemotaxis protein CheW
MNGESVNGAGGPNCAGGSNGASGPPTDLAVILAERTRGYAHVPPTVDAGTHVEVMLFRLGDEQYAVESRLLRSVQHTRGLAAVPCTPSHVAGILNVRGDIVTVLDLGIALGLAGASREVERAGVLLVELAQLRVGLLVAEVLGVRDLPLDGLDRSLSGREFVRGIAESHILLLDLERLLASGRFDVFEEVS